MPYPIELWLLESKKRKRLSAQSDCYRLVDLTKQDVDIRIDKLGPVLSFLCFSDNPIDEALFADIESFANKIQTPHWFFRQMINRGRSPNQKTLWKSTNCPEQWSAQENGMNFVFKLNEGTSPGLFLDQRDRRNWVKQHSKGKVVLNLFAYTSGFSIAAALGDAKKTISVDAGSRYIEWARENFKLNNIDPHGHEFWSIDAFDFLEGAIKRHHKFDMVICDPPSFGRSKRGVFKLSKNYRELLTSAASVLASNGHLVFSVNFEEWDQMEFERKCKDISKDSKLSILEFPTPPFDFNSRVLKTCIFKSL